jgi:hypothetical protein
MRLLFLRFVSNGSDFNEQMRMRQLVYGYRGSCRTVVAKVFSVDFVVSREVIHTDQIRRHFDDIFQVSALCAQDISNVVDDRPRLTSNVEMRRSHRIDFRAGNGVIGTAGTRPGNKEEVTGTFHVRIFAARLRFALNNVAFDLPHSARRCSHRCHSRIQTLFSSE